MLGRPIDLIFDIHTDPGAELDVACIQASAQAGETQIDNSRLQITALPVMAGRPPSVRIRSSIAVMEPILTMRLVLSCSGVVSRSYDFFAEVPASQVASSLPLVIAPPGTLVAPPAAKAAPQLAKPDKPPKDRAAPKSAAPKRAEAAASVAASESALPAAVPRKPRLSVEPLGDWLAEATPAPLRLSPTLQEAPQDAPSAQRAQAAALWQLLNISAQEVQQTQVRLQQQQAEIDAARASREKLQTTLTALQKQVDSMDVQRLPAALLYSLLALLVLICAALAWLWQRTRSDRPEPRLDSGWSNSETLRDKELAYSPPLDTESPAPLVPTAQAAPSSAGPVVLTKTAAPVSAEMPLAMPVVADQQTVPADFALVSVSTPAVATAAAAAVRMLNPEDLFDLQQQAEFFISVGEHDQAIEVMKQHIDENATASPLMYLELLRLYRSLGRSDDFKALRAQFQRHFNAVVPEFSAFQGGGRTLLDYPETAASIEAVWSDHAVLPLLEGCIFCPADGCSSTVEPFELPAYDDLLLLYAIASTTPANSRGAPPPRERTTPYAVELPQSSNPVEPLQSLGLVEQDLLSPASLPALDDEVDFDLGPFLDVDLLAPVSAGVEPPVKPGAAPAPELPVLGNLIEYDTHLLSKVAMPSPVAPLQPSAPASAWTFDLDLDLSEIDGPDARELPPLTEGVVPALEVTPAPTADQPIGFGVVTDRFEARFDLEDEEGKPMGF